VFLTVLPLVKQVVPGHQILTHVLKDVQKHVRLNVELQRIVHVVNVGIEDVIQIANMTDVSRVGGVKLQNLVQVEIVHLVMMMMTTLLPVTTVLQMLEMHARVVVVIHVVLMDVRMCIVHIRKLPIVKMGLVNV
jgi:hypothetical protein